MTRKPHPAVDAAVARHDGYLEAAERANRADQRCDAVIERAWAGGPEAMERLALVLEAYDRRRAGRPVVYLAHPVGAPTVAEVMENLGSARRWLHALVDATDWSIVASWMPYVETFDEDSYRARGLADDLAVVERCDAIVLVGGRISQGMRIEHDHAAAHGLAVVNLVALGDMPPADLRARLDEWRAQGESPTASIDTIGAVRAELARGCDASKSSGSGQR